MIKVGDYIKYNGETIKVTSVNNDIIHYKVLNPISKPCKGKWTGGFFHIESDYKLMTKDDVIMEILW